MPKGFSLHIGVNRVDQSHYLGLADLKAAVNDAKDYLHIAQNVFHYEKSAIFTDDTATTRNVKTQLSEYAKQLEAGDILFLSYSGHGSLVEDPNFKLKGDEAHDQTWCLFDRQLLDDEIFEAFKKFKDGVRILVISDSCHSGTVTRNLPGNSQSPEAILAKEEDSFTENLIFFLKKSGLRSKEVSPVLAARINARNADTYHALQEKYKRTRKQAGVGASVRLFAACQDNQITFDGDQNGRFTGVIKDLILSGKWQHISNVQQFIDTLRAAYAYPTPNFFSYGLENLNFDHNFPLKIDIPLKNEQNLTPIDSSATESTPITTPKPTTPPSVSAVYQYQLKLEFNESKVLKEWALRLCPKSLRMLKLTSEEANKTCFAYFNPQPDVGVWDLAHQVAEAADHNGIELEVEPAIQKGFPITEEIEGAKAAGKGFEYMHMWPPISNDGEKQLGWHLKEAYSQLGPARDELWEEIKAGDIQHNVRIAHIDTGWWPGHPALKDNPNILQELARSFIDGEEYENGDAVDLDKSNPMEQQMHGIGTLGIISGWQVEPELTYGEDIGFIGAAPFLEVIPIRVTDSVIILNPDNIAKAIDYAVKMNCEVITMSLGGNTNKRLAKAINQAYEAGVTFVSAAGNAIVRGAAKMGPRTLIYPARYERVLAACGVAQNHFPYDFEAQKLDKNLQAKSMDTDYMQGNWGPFRHMEHAIAAYTPNVPWLAKDEAHPIKKNGGGTSSATPQVATTAALWILKHKKDLEEMGYAGTWKQVEAVRNAMYHSTKPGPFPDWAKYFGQGIIQAKDALKVKPLAENRLKKAKKARSSWAGLGEMASMLLKRKKSISESDTNNLNASLQKEMQSLLMETEKGQDLLDEMQRKASEDTQATIRDYLLKMDGLSGKLRAFLS